MNKLSITWLRSRVKGCLGGWLWALFALSVGTGMFTWAGVCALNRDRGAGIGILVGLGLPFAALWVALIGEFFWGTWPDYESID